MSTPTLSVVVCTYNGERFIRQQLDSILKQTRQPDEIIVQDDGSTDGTLDILAEYAQAEPRLRVFKNAGSHGVNANFFSALRRASSHFIAIADQDDIWLPEKLELQLRAIGENMLCVGRSIAFSTPEPPEELSYDHRLPTCSLIRLLYASVPGHVMLFRRELLALLPPPELEVYRRSYYDVILGIAGAALGGIVFIDRPLVLQRRHAEATTLTAKDSRRERSAKNLLSNVYWGICHYAKVKPLMAKHFAVRSAFVDALTLPAGSAIPDAFSAQKLNKDLADARALMAAESEEGIRGLLRLMRLYIRRRHELFYTQETDPVAFVRAVLHPFMQVYAYRYLLEK